MIQKEAQSASFLPNFCSARVVFVVILVAELLAIVLTLAQPPHVSTRLYDLAMYSLFVQWIALTCIATLCLSQRYLERLNDYWIAGLSYGLTLVITFCITELAWWLQSGWGISDGYLRYGHGFFLLKSMGISAIVCALALRYFYVQHQWRRRAESEAEARFQALQSRIRPHFLFNCMNTIASLTRRQPKQAEEAIEDLADLFRVSLQDIHKVGTMAEELTLCERYLRIEKHRLGERLKIDWQTDVLPRDARLPLLCLQPLVENAIYHGIEPRLDGGIISISGKKIKNAIKLSIENPLPDSNIDKHDGNHLAQENISQRLTTFFEQEDLLQVESDNRHYRVHLTIPYPYEDSDR